MTRFIPTIIHWFSGLPGKLILPLIAILPGALFAQSDAVILGTLIFESAPIPVVLENANLEQNDAGPGLLPGSGKVMDLSPSPGSDASTETFEQAIRVTLEEEGMYSSLLAEQYETLAGMYFNQGRYPEAIATYEDAMHIHKVNKGLFNLDQSDIVRKLIRVHTSLGDFEAVDNHRHYLYYLHNKSLTDSDPRLIAEKLDWADWNIEAYVKGYRNAYQNPVSLVNSMDPARGLRTLNFDIPAQPPGTEPLANSPSTIPVSFNVPQLNSNSVITNAAVTDYNLRSIPYALSNQIMINQRLHDAEEIYGEVLESLQEQDGSPQEQMIMHEKLANIAYLLKNEYEKYERVQDQGSIAFNRANQEFTSDAAMMTNRLYIRTRNALEEFARQLEENSQMDTKDKAAAFITLGDLHLSFNKPTRAYDAYQHAFTLLRSADLSAEDAMQQLTPQPDLAVPAFGIHPYSRKFFSIQASTQVPFKGYLDVSFNKDAFGQLTGVNVIEESPGTPAVIRAALLDHLRQQQFRPAFDGETGISQSGINLRYYYFHQ